MLENKNTYIYSFDGKDLLNKTFKVSKFRKYKAALDYSLESIMLDYVAQHTYNKKKDRERMFFQINEKQYTQKVVNLTFKYCIKEYQSIVIDNATYYVHYESKLENETIMNIKFSNGVSLFKNNDKLIEIIKIDDSTSMNKNDLPKGFFVNNGLICVNPNYIKTYLNASQIREKIYKHGFDLEINGEIVHFVRFKRSSGSSRVGKCLFIDEKLYDMMLRWSMMGLKINNGDKIDLAALESYISLTTSSIIGTIDIKPQQILIMDDYNSTFDDRVMCTEIKKIDNIDKLHTDIKTISINNNIWDGQSLLDSSMFKNIVIKDNKEISNTGMLLLRNRFFKSCCFNTNIQLFFEDNNISDVSQLNGYTLAKKIEDIKLITTVSSIKYLKFGKIKKFLSNLESSFGIVKYEKPTKFFDGHMVQTHYQLLNTLQLNKEDIAELLKDSIDYIKLLKSDIRVFREHLCIKIKEKIIYGDINSTEDFMFNMLQLNDKFENNDIFNSFRQEAIKSYINNLKKGHVLVSGTYCVLFGNGLEMLQNSIKTFSGKSILQPNEVCCKNFRYDEKLIGSRSPHVTMGNIWLLKNTNKNNFKLLNKYFNTSNQIIHISSIENNILERLSSADFDSDAILLSNSELLIKKAEENYNKFLVPTSLIESEKIFRKNTLEEKCKMDIKTSENLIGEIINCAQDLNSKLWDELNSNGNVFNEKVIELYKIISQLDVMSCIEIDKAKKEFSVDNKTELENIKKIYLKSQKKPLFFKFLSKSKQYKVNNANYRFHKTSMDYLIKHIDDSLKDIKQPYRKGEKSPTSFTEMFTLNRDINISEANRKQARNIIDKSLNLKKTISSIWQNEDMSTTEKYIMTNDLKNILINEISELKVTSETIKQIVFNLEKDIKSDTKNKGLKNHARVLLKLLYFSHRSEFCNVFEETKETIEYISKVKNNETGDLIIYGLPYVIKTREKC